MPEEISPKGIYNTNVYFNNTYKDSWIRKPLSIEMIKDIDKSEYLMRQPVAIIVRHGY